MTTTTITFTLVPRGVVPVLQLKPAHAVACKFCYLNRCSLKPKCRHFYKIFSNTVSYHFDNFRYNWWWQLRHDYFSMKTCALSGWDNISHALQWRHRLVMVTVCLTAYSGWHQWAHQSGTFLVLYECYSHYAEQWIPITKKTSKVSISPHTYLCMWLPIHVGVKVNP